VLEFGNYITSPTMTPTSSGAGTASSARTAGDLPAGVISSVGGSAGLPASAAAGPSAGAAATAGSDPFGITGVVDRGEEDMDIGGDGALPVGATHHLQPPEAGTAPPADSSVDVVVPWLLEQVAKLGMHAWPLLEDGWCPDPSAADYRFNHRELLRIWGVHLTTRTNVGDIRQRYRMTARLLHPDKLAKYSVEVQQWGTHIMTQLNLAREEIEMRIDWVKRRVIPPPVTSDSYPFQEIPEAVQLFAQVLSGTPGRS